jgi:hypothetical protein
MNDYYTQPRYWINGLPYSVGELFDLAESCDYEGPYSVNTAINYLKLYGYTVDKMEKTA